MTKWCSSRECKVGLNIKIKSSNIILPINRKKEKNHILISTEAEITIDKIQLLFILKNLSQLRIEENFLDLIMSTYEILN